MLECQSEEAGVHSIAERHTSAHSGNKDSEGAPCANKQTKKKQQKVLNVGTKLISYSARQIDAVTGFITLGAASVVGRSASSVACVSTPLFMSQEIFRAIGHETAKSTVDAMLKVGSSTRE
jgi:hypothetical protein